MKSGNLTTLYYKIKSKSNPYFYHNDDYKRKKSSEEISLENEIFKEI